MSKQSKRPARGLFQRKKNGNWYLQYFITTDTGKKVQKVKSLKTANLDVALNERDKILRPLSAHNRKSQLEELKASLERTGNEIDQYQEEDRDKLSLAEAWEAFKKSTYRPDSGEATLRQYSFQWGAFVKYMRRDHPAIEYLREVSEKHADGYFHKINSRLAKGTVNKHIRLCKLVVSALQEAEHIEKNPFSHIKALKAPQNHRREIPWDKLAEICDKTEGEMKLLFFIGVYTGLRLGDCCLLSWDEIDLMRNWILTVPNKTASRNDTPLRIPIIQALKNMLADIPERKRRGYVLPQMAAKYSKSRDLVTDMIQDLLKSCGIRVHKKGTGEESRGEDGKIQKRAVLQYGFHSLRHSTVSILQEAGTPQAVVQAIVGHRTLAMTARYTHIGEKALREAVNAIPALEANDPDQNERMELKRLIDAMPIEQVKIILKQANEVK